MTQRGEARRLNEQIWPTNFRENSSACVACGEPVLKGLLQSVAVEPPF